MTTFDQILPIISEIMDAERGMLAELNWLVINRDLNGRVRFVVPEQSRENGGLCTCIEVVYQEVAKRLGAHAYPDNMGIIYEVDREHIMQGASNYVLEGFDNIWVVDRLATEANWARIVPENDGVSRIVFFSIKGGVGRSTALAATAWHLAQVGKRVLVMDLDLESPGISSALLQPDRQPTYGITDWLVEDLVGNGAAILGNMVATSNLSHDGEIHIVPAHGVEHGEYIAKLGRVWMPKIQEDGSHEIWSMRLERLLRELENHVKPDVVLIDSRSGIDDIASACVTGLGANLVLLFALEGMQTWNGYRMLFDQWKRAHVAKEMRDRLNIVAAIVPETDRIKYLEGLRENAYHVFSDMLYDEIAPADPAVIGRNESKGGKWQVGDFVEGWSFDEADESAPHYPWAVNWHRGFLGLRSLHGRMISIDAQEIQAVFGQLIKGISDIIDSRRVS